MKSMNKFETNFKIFKADCSKTIKSKKDEKEFKIFNEEISKSLIQIEKVLEENINSLIKIENSINDEDFYTEFFAIIGKTHFIWEHPTKIDQTQNEREQIVQRITKHICKIKNEVKNLEIDQLMEVRKRIYLEKEDTLEKTVLLLISYLYSLNLNDELFRQFPEDHFKCFEQSFSHSLNFLLLDYNHISGFWHFRSIYPEAIEITKKAKRGKDSFRNFVIRELYSHFVKYLGSPNNSLIISIIISIFPNAENLGEPEISTICKELR